MPGVEHRSSAVLQALARPVTDANLAAAYRADALFDGHRDDPEFGYRFMADEARAAGEPMVERTAWKICCQMGWFSAFSRKQSRGKKRRPGPTVRDDTVRRDFTVGGSNRLWLADITEHSHRRGQAALVCDQGRVVQPDRRVFDRLEDEVTAGPHCGPQRRRPPR